MPWISWAQTTLGADLQIATDHAGQPDGCGLPCACRRGRHPDDWELGMLHRAVTLGGSMVLGLAFLRNRMDAAALLKRLSGRVVAGRKMGQ